MTDPEAPLWRPPRGRGRISEVSTEIGTGDATWDRAVADLLTWAVKTRSGFRITPRRPVLAGERYTVTARIGPLLVREPIEVVQVISDADRVGFSYRTLPGHPVSGEEAFILHRDEDAVLLSIRSITRPAARGVWRWVFPALLVAQRIVRRRYLRALR